MIRIYIAFEDGVAVLRRNQQHWSAEIAMAGKECQCLAADPFLPERIYCGTFEEGLWQSNDAGSTWQPVAEQLPHPAVMSVAVSPVQRNAEYGTVWAGTEPSAVFRSLDGAKSWHECSALQTLPSKSSWSFPPRPWTHHVRWIEPDANDPNRVFAGIELGGVMRSLDSGETWEDRKPNSQHDCHTLRTHSYAPGLIYETAGGGFAESKDGGDTWSQHDEGLLYHYLWGLAVDPAEPGLVVLSASPGARSAHDNSQAEALLHRRKGEGAWEPLRSGLPAAKGTRAFMLATNKAEPGVFYAATRQELYRSTDQGVNWQRQQIDWPEDVSFSSVQAIVITEAE